MKRPISILVVMVMVSLLLLPAVPGFAATVTGLQVNATSWKANAVSTYDFSLTPGTASTNVTLTFAPGTDLSVVSAVYADSTELTTSEFQINDLNDTVTVTPASQLTAAPHTIEIQGVTNPAPVHGATISAQASGDATAGAQNADYYGAFSHWNVLEQPTGPVTAGTPFNIRVAAVDANSSVVRDYDSNAPDLMLTTTDTTTGTAAPAGFNVTQPLSQGEALFSPTLKHASASTDINLALSSAPTVSLLGSPISVAVDPGPATAWSFWSSGSPVYAGVATGFDVVAGDAYGNAVPTVTDPVSLTVSPSAGVTASPDISQSLPLVSGSAHVDFTFASTGTYTITAAGGTLSQSSTTVTAGVAPPGDFSFSEDWINADSAAPLVELSLTPPSGAVKYALDFGATTPTGQETWTAIPSNGLVQVNEASLAYQDGDAQVLVAYQDVSGNTISYSAHSIPAYNGVMITADKPTFFASNSDTTVTYKVLPGQYGQGTPGSGLTLQVTGRRQDSTSWASQSTAVDPVTGAATVTIPAAVADVAQGLGVRVVRSGQTIADYGWFFNIVSPAYEGILNMSVSGVSGHFTVEPAALSTGSTYSLGANLNPAIFGVQPGDYRLETQVTTDTGSVYMLTGSATVTAGQTTTVQMDASQAVPVTFSNTATAGATSLSGAIVAVHPTNGAGQSAMSFYLSGSNSYFMTPGSYDFLFALKDYSNPNHTYFVPENGVQVSSGSVVTVTGDQSLNPTLHLVATDGHGQTAKPIFTPSTHYNVYWTDSDVTLPQGLYSDAQFGLNTLDSSGRPRFVPEQLDVQTSQTIALGGPFALTMTATNVSPGTNANIKLHLQEQGNGHRLVEWGFGFTPTIQAHDSQQYTYSTGGGSLGEAVTYGFTIPTSAVPPITLTVSVNLGTYQSTLTTQQSFGTAPSTGGTTPPPSTGSTSPAPTTTTTTTVDSGVPTTVATINEDAIDVTGTDEAIAVDLSEATTEKKSADMSVSVLQKLAKAAKGVALDAGEAQLVIPAAALVASDVIKNAGADARVSISVQAIDPSKNEQINGSLKAAESTGLSPVGKVLAFTVEVGSSNVTSFDKPVTVKIPFQGAADPTHLGVYRYNPTTGEWEYRGGKVVGNSVEIQLTGFSEYAVMEYDKTFADADGHWAKADLELMAARHVIQGDGRNVRPDDAITRAEFAAMLARALGLKPGSATATFQDVKTGDWYAGDVEAAGQAGLVTGANGNFSPNALITRQEMAVMLARALSLREKAPSLNAEQVTSALAGFTDGSQVAAWATAGTAAAAQMQLLQGKGAHNLAPTDHATRAEAAVTLERLLKVTGEL